MYILLPLFCITTTQNFQTLPCYMFYGGKVVCGPVHFFLCCSFSPQCSPWHFSFSHHRYKIFMFFFQQNWSPLFFICHSSSFSVIHANVDIKIKSKERIGFVVVIFLSLKVRVAMQFNDEMQGYLKSKISPRLTWWGWRTYEQDPCMYGWFCQNQNFLDA